MISKRERNTYQLFTLRPMHALSSLTAINRVTLYTQQSRYNLTVRTRKTRRATTDAQIPRRAARPP
jgi:hypothetical protein